MFSIADAYAMSGAAQPAGDGGSMLASMAPLVLMFAVFYFLLIRPQQKRAKEHKLMLEQIKRGDKVITAGGIYGRVVEVNPDTVVVDTGDSKITVGRAFISTVIGKNDAEAKTAKEDK